MLKNVFVDIGVDICVYEYCILYIDVNVGLDWILRHYVSLIVADLSLTLCH